MRVEVVVPRLRECIALNMLIFLAPGRFFKRVNLINPLKTQ